MPKKEAAEPEWQAAIEAPTMFAQIGVMRTLNRHVDPERKEHHWGRRKLKRAGL